MNPRLTFGAAGPHARCVQVLGWPSPPAGAASGCPPPTRQVPAGPPSPDARPRVCGKGRARGRCLWPRRHPRPALCLPVPRPGLEGAGTGRGRARLVP